MSNSFKDAFLAELRVRCGNIHRLAHSLSLYDLGSDAGRIYIRYSRLHPGGRTFYGLRQEDLFQLQGHASAICFLWDGQEEPLFVPFAQYEDVFSSVSPARDGQYKVQVFLQDEGTDFYIANAGRFNVEGHMGWQQLEAIIRHSSLTDIPKLSHAQVQTLLGAIGADKGYDIWIPANDQGGLDWRLTHRFAFDAALPLELRDVSTILSEIDVIWIERGAGRLRAAFEVEYSTPIYSGLLRFNDVHLSRPAANVTYTIVSDCERRSLFVRQLSRPTFRLSRLAERCTFLEYSDVYSWYTRIRGITKRVHVIILTF